jgi:pyrroloquinoline quinone (PQQ) biosynthesis protein C
MPRDPKAAGFIAELDKKLDEFCVNTRFFNESFNEGRAQMFVMQHRLNTRQRNSVLKLRVATLTPDWETRLRIIGAASEELIADEEFGGGLPHWQILENLGVTIGMQRAKIRAARPLKSTQLAWNAWAGVMSHCHWLEGLLANVILERPNIRGYGNGIIKQSGWFGLERARWKKVFGLTDGELGFFKLHEEADEIHSDLGWKALAKHAKDLKMEERLLEVADQNLAIWEHYLNGIGDAGDELNKSLAKRKSRKAGAVAKKAA